MSGRFFMIVGLVAVLAGTASAFLPPDASAREPQIRAYRQRVRENYEKRQIERQAQAIRAYEQTRADIFTPPWMRTGAQAAVETESGGVAPVPVIEQKRNHRFLVSIVFLILIGSAVVGIRYATREIDE